MKELIKIEKKTIGSEEVNSVDARGLWEFLEVKTRFNDWITRQIKQYNFVINSDFCMFMSKSSGGRRREDYTISIDMAKELSMVEKNQKGKEARKYFIKMEGIAKGKIEANDPINILENELRAYALFEVPKHIAQIESVKRVKNIHNVDFSHLLDVAPAQQNIKNAEVMLEPTELGKHFDLSGMKINQKLMKIGLQLNDGSGWAPTRRGSKISSKHSWSKGDKSGYNLKWNLGEVKSAINQSKPRRQGKLIN